MLNPARSTATPSQNHCYTLHHCYTQPASLLQPALLQHCYTLQATICMQLQPACIACQHATVSTSTAVQSTKLEGAQEAGVFPSEVLQPVA
jgi:hypothetical protein